MYVDLSVGVNVDVDLDRDLDIYMDMAAVYGELCNPGDQWRGICGARLLRQNV